MCPKYFVECIKYQKVLYSSMKRDGFVPENGSEVFVRNIPVEDTETDLKIFFERIDEIFQIRLMMHENGKENRGLAYVTYFNCASAKRAVSILNNTSYRRNCYLKIEISLNNCRLFVGSIPTLKNKDQVWQELYKNGITNIVDVIMYRSYTDRAENRGFVFVEFKTHEEAAYTRAKFAKTLLLWGSPVIVDWSIPIPTVDDEIMDLVTVIYIRNLDVAETPESFQRTILKFTQKQCLEKVYKFKNYAFVHLKTRTEAERVKQLLEDYFKDTPIEVAWAKPSSKYTTQEYRQKKVNSYSSNASKSSRSSTFTEKRSRSHEIRRKVQEDYRSPSCQREEKCCRCGHENNKATVLRISTPIKNCHTPPSFFKPEKPLTLSSEEISRISDLSSGYETMPTQFRSSSLCEERNCSLKNFCLGTCKHSQGINLQLDDSIIYMSPNYTNVKESPLTNSKMTPIEGSLMSESSSSLLSISTDKEATPPNTALQSPHSPSQSSYITSRIFKDLKCSTPTYKPTNFSPLMDKMTQYEQITSKLAENKSDISKHPVSPCDLDIIPTNLDQEDLIDIAGFIGDILD